MGFRFEGKTKAFGAPTRSQKDAINVRASRRDVRARRRFAIAQLVGNARGTLVEKQTFVEMAMQAGLIPPGALPSIETIRSLGRKWEEGAQTISDYYDLPRRGRPPVVLKTSVEKAIEAEIRSGRAVNAQHLTRNLQRTAKERGEAGPQYHQIHKRIAQAGRLRRAAARYGSRAAEIDGMPHARVPARRPHDVWALDELRLPVWTKQYDDVSGCWVSAMLDLILIVDLRTGVIPGYHLADPSRRRDEQGVQFRTGFDSADVLAALFCAAFPELATDATRQFSGYLPTRLRWDNARQHKQLATRFADMGVGLTINPIRKRRAISNGAAELRVKILKSLCAGIRGHVDDCIPTDRVDTVSAVDLPLQRSTLAGYTDDRESRKVPLLPEQLHGYQEICAITDELVRQYNYDLRNRRHGRPPAVEYASSIETRRQRSGEDLIHALDPVTTTVGTGGIIHRAFGREHQFLPLIGGMMVMLDQPFTYYADPLSAGSSRGMAIRSTS